ncbi:MAG: hypothetical protein HFG54_00980 [Lachnospiraceae bacterium]|jgi:hypothetical protein|nr:hypothetical protein [Lachnospiraceae bacterium]
MFTDNRLIRSWKKDRETLKALSLRQKLGFIFDYYKGLFFLAFILLLLLFYIGDMLWQSHRVIDLQGFFVNDRQNLFPAGELIRDFSAYQHTPRGHRIAFEDSLYVDLDSGSEYHAASQGKIVAYTAARELDFLVAPKELALYYAKSFPLYDLEQLLADEPDLLARVQADLITAKDGNGTAKACCLELKASRFLKNPAYDGTDSYCLLVLSYTPHTQAMVSFLRYAYSLPPKDASLTP